MTGLRKILAGSLLAATILSAFAMPGTAYASAKGKKNTAIVLGAITAYELLKGKTTNALVAGAATAYAYSEYQDARRDETRRGRWAYDYRGRDRYDSRYDNRYNVPNGRNGIRSNRYDNHNNSRYDRVSSRRDRRDRDHDFDD